MSDDTGDQQVVLIAGPEKMPTRQALANGLAQSGRVLVIGDDPLHSGLSDPLFVEQERWERMAVPAPLDAIQAWIDHQDAPCWVVLAGVHCLRDRWAGATVDELLLEFLESVQLKQNVTLCVIQPLLPEQILGSNPMMVSIRDRVDELTFWTLQGPRTWQGRGVEKGGGWGIGQWLVEAGRPDRWSPGLGQWSVWLSFLSTLFVCVGMALFLGQDVLFSQENRLLGTVEQNLPGSLWVNWWVDRWVSEGGPLFTAQHMYWPAGANVLTTFGNVGVAFLSLPFQWIWGFPNYWNPFLLTGLVANGLAAWWLARSWGAAGAGPFLAGVSFCAAPVLLGNISLANQGQVWALFLPLAIGLGRRAFGPYGSEKDGWLAGIALAAGAMVWWFYGLFAGVCLLFLGWHRSYCPGTKKSQVFTQWTRIVRILLPCSITALPLVAEATRGEMAGLSWLERPWRWTRSVGETLQLLEATARSVSLPEILAHPAIGISALPASLCMGLLLAWFLSPTRRQRFWPFLLVATAVLALGPYLSPEMEASDSWVILPYGLLQSVVPFLSRLHQPDQMLILFALAQAMMVALLWTAVRPRIAIHPRWVALCAIIAAIWSAPRILGATPMASHHYSPPAWVSQLGESGAVIEIPMGWSEASVLYQALHGHPVTGGPGVASQMFDSTDYRNLFETRPELAFFWSPAQTELTEAHVSSLLESGAGYVAVHHAAMTSLTKDPADYRTWALENVASRVHTALGPPVYGDDEVRLYRIRAGVVSAVADVVDGGKANEENGME